MSKPVTTVFLDRDGVINEKMPDGQYVASADEFRLISGVPEAIARLNRGRVRVLVVSNQRGIALGIMTPVIVENLHRSLQQQLNARGARIDGFYYCPHDKDACNCRKPLPGLFQQAIIDFPDIQAEKSVTIGDSVSDVEFGRRLGMRTIWIRGASKDRRADSHQAEALADLSCSSLDEAVDAVLSAEKNSSNCGRCG